jgi:hypothetical protein
VVQLEGGTARFHATERRSRNSSIAAARSCHARLSFGLIDHLASPPGDRRPIASRRDTVLCMGAIPTIGVVAAIVVVLIVVLGTSSDGWMGLTGYSEYQRGEEALRTWWRRVTGRQR